ncbi:MAG: Mrp/NBP35 family ATP-binding protein [Acidimicrobiales bacterium]
MPGQSETADQATPAIVGAVGAVADPQTGAALGELHMIRSVGVDESSVEVELALAPAQVHARDAVADAVAAALADVDGVERVEVRFGAMTPDEERAAAAALRLRQPEEPPYFSDGSTKVILVTSGKGGVGKSTVAVNVAQALAAQGKQVGLLDGDVWGYCVPRMLGSDGEPVGIGDLLLPERVRGIKAVSIGFLADEGSPVVWRGPMLHEAIQQFVSGVYWGKLDTLIVDLPPGTGDVPISLASLIPGANVVVVTTPQEVASRVAERAGRMATRAKLRLIGVVENMSGFVCSHCGTPTEIFGGSGGQSIADALGVPLLGRVPISASLRSGADGGRPIFAEDPDDPAARALQAISVEIDRRARAMVRRRIPLPLFDSMQQEHLMEQPAATAPSGGERS